MNDGVPGAVGAEATIRNCSKIPEKIVDANKYKQSDAADTYIIPLTDLMVRNDWGGAILIRMDVTALDNYRKPINTCTHETIATSPLVLDFTAQARLSTVSLHESQTQFDLLANGRKARTGWVTGERGLLALDLNRDGVINDGSELFGEGTSLIGRQVGGPRKAVNGYEALQQYDVGNRGFIDVQTPIYDNLLVWFDRNQDGISQEGELVSIRDLGITRIDTRYEEAPQYQQERGNPFANQVRWRSKFYDRERCRAGCYSYDVYFANERVHVSAIKSSR